MTESRISGLPTRLAGPILNMYGTVDLFDRTYRVEGRKAIERMRNVGPVYRAAIEDWLQRRGVVYDGPNPRARTAVALERYALYLRRAGWTVTPPKE